MDILLKKVKITVTATIAVWRLLSTGPSVAVGGMTHEVQLVTLKKKVLRIPEESLNHILPTNLPSISRSGVERNIVRLFWLSPSKDSTCRTIQGRVTPHTSLVKPYG